LNTKLLIQEETLKSRRSLLQFLSPLGGSQSSKNKRRLNSTFNSVVLLSQQTHVINSVDSCESRP